MEFAQAFVQLAIRCPACAKSATGIKLNVARARIARLAEIVRTDEALDPILEGIDEQWATVIRDHVHACWKRR